MATISGAIGYISGFVGGLAPPQLALAAAALAVLAAIAVFDLRTGLIPDALNAALLALGVCAIWAFPEVGLAGRIAGFFAVSAPMLISAILIKGSFGGGDIKLMAAAGFFLGWQCLLLAFLGGALLGGVYALAALAFAKKSIKGHIPFGPFLATGIMASFLAGGPVFDYLFMGIA